MYNRKGRCYSCAGLLPNTTEHRAGGRQTYRKAVWVEYGVEAPEAPSGPYLGLCQILDLGWEHSGAATPSSLIVRWQEAVAPCLYRQGPQSLLNCGKL